MADSSAFATCFTYKYCAIAACLTSVQVLQNLELRCSLLFRIVVSVVDCAISLQCGHRFFILCLGRFPPLPFTLPFSFFSFVFLSLLYLHISFFLLLILLYYATLNPLIISYLHLSYTTGHRCHITHRASHLQTHLFGLVDPPTYTMDPRVDSLCT